MEDKLDDFENHGWKNSVMKTGAIWVERIDEILGGVRGPGWGMVVTR
jgi:hypothetical protein